MAKPNNPAGREIVLGLLEQYPDAPAMTLARKAYGEHPGVWRTLEACRAAFRLQLGVLGEHSRKRTADKRFYRAPRVPGAWRESIPPALSDWDAPWRAVSFDGPARWLVLSDIHVPYHDKAALELAIEYGIEHGADHVLLNGDLLDFYALSFWEKDPRKRDFAREVRMGVAVLEAIRAAFPDARIVFKEGNHEERFERYMQVKAPELLGMSDFEWASVYRLADFGVERIGEKRPLRIGKLYVLHGHEYRFNISNPVNPARGFFLRAKTHVLGGHLHQTSQHSAKALDENVISTWSTGCLCDLHPEYRPLNDWNHGFAFVAVDETGAFRTDNLRIVDGRVW